MTNAEGAGNTAEAPLSLRAVAGQDLGFGGVDGRARVRRRKSTTAAGPGGESMHGMVAARRAVMVVRCACEILGLPTIPTEPALHLDLSVRGFAAEIERRYGVSHPKLVFRSDSAMERARLDRQRCPELPKVLLRRGRGPRL
jgi:hypothetical protein